MPVNFFTSDCQSTLNDKLFGLCDNPPPANTPAYTCVTNSNKWIAKVINSDAFTVLFVAIDKCLNLKKPNGHIDSSCDAMMVYDNKIVFVELKECDDNKNAWIRKADAQLRNTIEHFKQNHSLTDYSTKKAYIANNKHPNFRSTQMIRMQKFKDETGVQLRIENRIVLS